MDHTAFIQISFGILLLSLSILLLTTAAHMPYWAKTDRWWKTEEIETPETKGIEK